MKLMKTFIPWFITYIIISAILHSLKWEMRKYLLIAFFMTCLIYVCGWWHVVLIIVHSLVSYLGTLTRSSTLVWIVCLALLSTLNFEPFITYMKMFLHSDEGGTYLLMLTLAWCNMRCLSFGLCKVTTQQINRDKGYLQYNFADLLFYIFYLPLFINGPFMVYNTFKAQANREEIYWTKSRIVSLSFQFLRLSFWFLINNLILHFMYFGSMQYNPYLLNILSPWTLSGIVYCQGQFFYMKYLVIFGAFSFFARLDGVEPLKGPLCVSHIFYYSEMWKYFDRGLYSFLKTHIYVPLGGSRRGLLHQLLASGACFLFIFYWHGADYYLFLWTLLNFFSVTLEGLGSYLNSNRVVQNKMRGYSSCTVNAIKSLCAIPVFLTSVLSLFFFLGDSNGGYIMFKRIFLQGNIKVYLVLLVSIYCFIQTVKELRKHIKIK